MQISGCFGLFPGLLSLVEFVSMTLCRRIRLFHAKLCPSFVLRLCAATAGSPWTLAAMRDRTPPTQPLPLWPGWDRFPWYWAKHECCCPPSEYLTRVGESPKLSGDAFSTARFPAHGPGDVVPESLLSGLAFGLTWVVGLELSRLSRV